MVNNSVGNPGTSPSIRIRGFNSINGSNTPLYVVDGIVFEGSIADINPQDVESMSVLKDAASCALYGNRGANGVILITTKKAKNVGKVDVTLQVNQGVYERGLPFYDRLSADQWMETMYTGYVNGLMSANSKAYPNIDAARAFAKDNIVALVIKNNIYNKADKELYSLDGKLQGTMLPGYNDLDWWNIMSQTGYRQEYNMNAAAASEKFNLFSSIGYLKEQGYIIKTDFERFNARITANYNPTSFFKTGLIVNGTHQESTQGLANASSLGLVSNPFLVLDKAPVYPYYLHDETGAVVMKDGQPTWNVEKYNGGSNVAWSTRLDDKLFGATTIDGSIYGTAVLPYGFDFTVRGSMYVRKYTSMNYMNNVTSSQAGIGLLTKGFGTYKTHTFMQTLNWSRDFGMHHVDALLDHENYQYGYDVASTTKRQQNFVGIMALSNFSDFYEDGEDILERRTESYLGRARYNFDQKYFGEASIRRDGTSRFTKENRWGTFWSIGGSWIISKEDFMHSLDFVNYLKLRAAYGSVGNDASASAYSYWALYSFNDPLNKNTTITPTQLAAPNLKWEATKTFDVAIDGSVLDDRINFSVGYFNKRNSDLIFSKTLASSVGSLSNSGYNPSILLNIGTMDNYGWEIQLGGDIVRNRDFKWSASVDATFMKNKIVKLPDNRDIANSALFMGKSIYEKYTYAWAGVDKLTGNSLYEMVPDSPDYYKYDDQGNRVYQEADYISNVKKAKAAGAYVEIDGVPYTTKTTYAKRKIMGTALPTVYGSFGTNASWKGLNASLLFTYSLGGKSMNSLYQGLMSISATNPSAMHKDILNSWTAAPAGIDENSSFADRVDPNGVPVLNTELSQYNTVSSSRFLISNNYLTLKNVNVNYDLPKAWVSALKLQGINLAASVDNLFIIAAQKGFNPQYSFGGGQGAYYVPARVYSFQLQVKF